MDEEQAFDLLMAACPSALADGAVDAYAAAFEDADEPSRYVRTSALAQHLVACLESGSTAEVRSVADAIEVILADGDDDAVQLVRMGLVEDLQNTCSHHDVGVDGGDVAALLGPAGRRTWDEVDQLWFDAGRWADDSLRVTVAQYDAVTDPNLRAYLRASKRRMPDGMLVGLSDIVAYETMRGELTGVPGLGRGGPRWGVLAAIIVVVAILVLVLLG